MQKQDCLKKYCTCFLRFDILTNFVLIKDSHIRNKYVIISTVKKRIYFENKQGN